MNEKCSNEYIDKFEREFALKLVMLKDLRIELSGDSVVEKMENQVEEGDKATLLSMIVTKNAKQ